MYFSVHSVIFFAPVSPKFLGSAVVFAEVTGGAGPRCAGQRSWHVEGFLDGFLDRFITFLKISCKIPRFP